MENAKDRDKRRIFKKIKNLKIKGGEILYEMRKMWSKTW